MSNDLLIRINADAKNVKKAYDDVRKETEDLEGVLSKVAAVSAVAFAAFTAEIYLSVQAFEESEAASRRLTQSLQNQGIYTKELVQDYKQFAQIVQEKTGIDDDAITSAQAVLQSFIGQTEITQELTTAIADLSETMGGDLEAAATQIGKTIGTNTNAFAKQGLAMDENATKGEKVAQVLEFINTKAGGMAEAANQGVGGIRGLTTAFGNFQEAIGEKFAPVIAAAIKGLTTFFNWLSQSPVVQQLAVTFLAVGATITGVVAAIASGSVAFLALSAAATAAGTTIGAAAIALLPIVGIVAGLVAAVVLLALNWDKAMAAVKAASVGMVTLVSGLFSGLGAILNGAFHLDAGKIKAGLLEIKNAFKQSKDDTVSTFQAITAEQAKEELKQDEAKAEAAKRKEQKEREHQANLRAIRAAEIEILKLENEHASQALIDIKQQELGVLKALSQEKTAAEVAELREKHAQLVALEDEQRAEDIERARSFAEIQAEMKQELTDQGIEVDSTIRADRLAQIQATAKTEADIDRQTQEEILQKRIDARNREMADRKKFGEKYAIINKAINSDEVQGTKNAADELVALQQSKNSTLKAIGKVAAVASITISTAESAMNIYKGFSTIPVVGQALGVAGAAAAVLFGAERIAAVTAAADGGLIEGGIAGRDSVPAMLMPGELVVPRKNFNDVVGSVQGKGGGDLDGQILAELQNINQKFSSPQQTVIQGDVMADDAFIDALVRRISDAVEFRNGQIFGVTA